jgi:predicted outer membrane protein
MKNSSKRWIRHEINDHQKTTQRISARAQTGRDPEVRAFARTTLPVLCQKHLKAVQAAQKKMAAALQGRTRIGRAEWEYGSR